jgi:hypothetical protein
MALIVPHAQLLSIKYLFNPPLYLAGHARGGREERAARRRPTSRVHRPRAYSGMALGHVDANRPGARQLAVHDAQTAGQKDHGVVPV